MTILRNGAKRVTRAPALLLAKEMHLAKSKRSQAAMEFLMTYGWAILAAIIAIGVLFLIVGNPNSWIGDRFQLTDPFKGEGASASAATGVQIEFTNGVGEAITVNDVVIDNCGAEDNAGAGWAVASNARQAVTVTCSPVLVAGDRIRGDITISYTKTGSSITQKGTGSINMKITA